MVQLVLLSIYHGICFFPSKILTFSTKKLGFLLFWVQTWLILLIIMVKFCQICNIKNGKKPLRTKDLWGQYYTQKDQKQMLGTTFQVWFFKTLGITWPCNIAAIVVFVFFMINYPSILLFFLYQDSCACASHVWTFVYATSKQLQKNSKSFIVGIKK